MLKNVSRSKAKAQVERNLYDQKLQQIEAAVKYCKENNCRGKKALATGKFDLIKDHKTITRRLDGEVKSGYEKAHVSILLPEEEDCLVQYAINKARAMQPLKRKKMTEMILNILRIRVAANKKMGGRKRVKLSRPALEALNKESIGQYFWMRFDAKYNKVLTRKRIGHTSLARAAAVTTPMAIAHIDSLAEELISKGIMVEAVQERPGVWTGRVDGSRVFNRDETPQAIRYGIDGSANNLAYCGKGSACDEAVKENREFVTIEPIISLDGEVIMCHVIFAAAGITSAMAPRKAVDGIPNLVISVTENGYQTGESCLGSCKLLDTVLDQKGVIRPIAMCTDGHSSRFDLEVLRFNQAKKMTSHVSPHDTTSVTQPLDQINAAFHSMYNKEVDKFFTDNHVNREVFMEILADVWKNWTTKESVIKAWKRCGISAEGLSYEWMQQDKLKAGDALVEEAAPTTPQKKKEPWDIDSPKGVRKGSLEYERKKNELYREALRKMSQTIVSPDEVEGFMQIDKIRVPAKRRAVRLTAVHGSMEGSEVLKLREAAEKVQEEKTKQKNEKLKDKSQQKNDFITCKVSCVCKENVCKASGFKQCPVCSEVMKSQCSKKKCSVNGIKPLMVFCAFDAQKKSKRKEKAATRNKKRKLVYESDEEMEEEEYEDALFEVMLEQDGDDEEVWSPAIDYSAYKFDDDKENIESGNFKCN